MTSARRRRSSLTASLWSTSQPPRWKPGTLAGYQSITLGFCVGEVIRRITGQPVGEFFAAEVAGPLGARFHMGLTAEHDDRVATLVVAAYESR